MKTLAMTFAVSAGLLVAAPLSAQVNTGVPRQPGETAMQYAQRINACNGAEILSADFSQNQTRLSVRCPQGAAVNTDGMSGGLTAGAAAAAAGVLIVFGLSGGSSTGSTTFTTGTN
ncbi:hypothetical protein [Roseovarius indicus]|uniref:hypothetical protein n=1 Tax=Roseovarius indicus TaxID=540747 RepID=UPI004058970F